MMQDLDRFIYEITYGKCHTERKIGVCRRRANTAIMSNLDKIGVGDASCSLRMKPYCQMSAPGCCCCQAKAASGPLVYKINVNLALNIIFIWIKTSAFLFVYVCGHARSGALSRGSRFS